MTCWRFRQRNLNFRSSAATSDWEQTLDLISDLLFLSVGHILTTLHLIIPYNFYIELSDTLNNIFV